MKGMIWAPYISEYREFEQQGHFSPYENTIVYTWIQVAHKHTKKKVAYFSF
jgi:hypothetical protein